KLLAEPNNLIPRLNDYTGRYYLSLEYPPSRNYTRRWTQNNPHPGLVKLFQKNFSECIEHCQNLVKLKPFFDEIPINLEGKSSSEPGWIGGPINAIDSAFLYYFVTTYKPNIYLEIGSGVTTLFAARAKRDHQLTTKIISIDPEPRHEVDKICDQVIRQGLEVIDLSIFSQLEAGDIVFMDGSHRSFMNSDVTVFMLDVIPLLKSGVIIHFHDIVLPYDYADMFDSWYWNEQYILATYLLASQNNIKVVMPSKFISQTPEFKEIIENTILLSWTGMKETWLDGGSLWFTKI
ncbi:MAG: class I SAM-dependent methyltransferase, partial [Microcystaceae cyanobacterium]